MFSRRINYYPYLLAMVLLLIIFTLLFLDYRLKASIIEIAKAKAQITVTENINSVINQQIVTKIEYQDIVNIHKDKEDRIVLIQPNTIILNKMMTNSVIEITHALDQLSEKSIDVPLGQITGSKILAGYGPKMKVKVITVGQVYVNVLNKFESAGINQTRHLIYFEIESKVKVAVPFLDEELQVSTTVPLAETIIIGDVPETYVGYDNGKTPVYPLIKGK
ncbi:MAG TPA: sporulation protein YunB [Syntrophomonadaceae bacterium]|nr:sporulation protein YunB [Syntrophomonadaceae bacterium]HPR94559.1 sporulation protein YunB [Syntrophomonadaceae bacterium]